MAGQGTTNKLSVKEWAAPLAISAIAFVIFTVLLWLGSFISARHSYWLIVQSSVIGGSLRRNPDSPYKRYTVDL